MTTQRNIVKLAAVAVLVAGCGGGGSGGDDNGGGSSNPPPSGGTSQTMFATGAITGFGSVIVNGVRYDTDSAQVSIEDRPASAMDLKVGQVVRIEATIDDKGGARARSVSQDHLLQGPVTAIDAAAGTLTVAGQIVTTDADTLFDDSIPTRSLAGLSIGDVVEIHGFASAQGARATRIEMAGSGETEVEVTGLVANLDTAAQRFEIGDLRIDYSSATLEDFGSGGIAAGQLVEVKGTSFLPDGTLRATRVDREDNSFGGDGDKNEIEGLVTRFVSATDFDVAGQRVTTTASTRYENGTAADLALDIKVEVEGRIDANGTLVASKVDFKRRSSARLTGPVESIDTAAGTFRALGVTVVVSSTTMLEDHESDDHFFNLSSLRAGDWVEVRGQAEAGTGRLLASRLERDDADDEVELRGTASDVSDAGLTLLGVSVQFTAGTKFEDHDVVISREQFLDRAPGAIVEVDGTWTGAAILADEAEIEHD
jgi:hypothetical protein